MDNPTTTNDKMASNNENETVQIEEDCNGGDLDKTDLDDMNFNNTNLEITDSDNTEDRSNVENKDTVALIGMCRVMEKKIEELEVETDELGMVSYQLKRTNDAHVDEIDRLRKENAQLRWIKFDLEQSQCRMRSQLEIMRRQITNERFTKLDDTLQHMMMEPSK